MTWMGQSGIMQIPKQKRIRDKKHLKWIASLPCCVTGKSKVQAAHIRHGLSGGMGLKPCDSLTVPLHFMAHKMQHSQGEIKFWKQVGGVEKAKKLANNLYKISGDTQQAMHLIARFRKCLG